MTAYATMNETKVPAARVIHSLFVRISPLLMVLINLYPLAPIIVGIDKKNENSAAAFLEKPKKKPPIIVDPDLDIPGHSARH